MATPQENLPVNPQVKKHRLWIIDFDQTLTLHHTGTDQGMHSYRNSQHYNNKDEIRKNIKFLEEFKQFAEERMKEGDIFAIASFTAEGKLYPEFFKGKPYNEITPDEFAAYEEYMKHNPQAGLTGKELINLYVTSIFGENHPFKDKLIQAFQPSQEVRSREGKRLHINNVVADLQQQGIEVDDLIMYIDDDNNNCRIAEADNRGVYLVNRSDTTNSYWGAVALQPEISLFKQYSMLFSLGNIEDKEKEDKFYALWGKLQADLYNGKIRDPQQIKDVTFSLVRCLRRYKDEPGYEDKFRGIMQAAEKYNDPQIYFDLVRYHNEKRYGFNDAEKARDYIIKALESGNSVINDSIKTYLNNNKELNDSVNKKYPNFWNRLVVQPEINLLRQYSILLSSRDFADNEKDQQDKFYTLWDKLQADLYNGEIKDPQQIEDVTITLVRCLNRYKDVPGYAEKFRDMMNRAAVYQYPQIHYELAIYHNEKRYGFNDAEKARDYIKESLESGNAEISYKSMEYLRNNKELYESVIKKYPEVILRVPPSTADFDNYMQWMVNAFNNPKTDFSAIQTVFRIDTSMLDQTTKCSLISNITDRMALYPKEIFSRGFVAINKNVEHCDESFKDGKDLYNANNRMQSAEKFAKVLLADISPTSSHELSERELFESARHLDEPSRKLLYYYKQQVAWYTDLDSGNPLLRDLINKQIDIQRFCNYPINVSDKSNVEVYQRLKTKIDPIITELQAKQSRSPDEENIYQKLHKKIIASEGQLRMPEKAVGDKPPQKQA